MKQWKQLFIGLLLGAATAGISFGVWRWGGRQARTPAQWIAELKQPGSTADNELANRGEAGLEILLEARKSEDINVHRRAVRGLSKMGEPAARRLAPLLPRGRGRVEVALVALGKPAVPFVEELLARDESAAVAARVLGMMGKRSEGARSSLLGLLQDPTRDAEARAAAALALGQLGDNDATVLALASATRGAPVRVRYEAIRALGLMGRSARAARRPLLAVLGDEDASLRAAASRVLGRLGSRAAVTSLATLAMKGESAAAEALARLGQPSRRAVESLLRSDRIAARQAILGLGPLILPELLQALDGKKGRAVVGILEALGPAAAGALPLLEKRLDTPGRGRLEAAALLVALTPSWHEKASLLLGQSLQWNSGEKERMVAEAVLALAAPGPLALLGFLPMKVATHDDSREFAAVSLARASSLPVSLLPLLRKGIRRNDIGNLCLIALPAVGAKAREAMPDILAALDRPATRLHAAAALARVTPERMAEALPAFREALREEKLFSLAGLLCRLPHPPPALLDDVRRRLDRPSWPLLRLLLAYPRPELLDLAPDLAALLMHPDEAIRASAGDLVRYLGAPASPFVRPLLARRDVSPEAVLAARHLGLIATPGEKEIQRAIELLGHAEAEQRAIAAAALANAPKEKLAPHAAALAECLFDPDRRVREAAARALAGLPDAASALHAASNDGDLFVRTAANESLLQSPPDAEEAARRLVAAAPLLPIGLRLRIANQFGANPEMEALLEADSRCAPPGEALAALSWLARHTDGSVGVDRLAAALAAQGETEEAARSLARLGNKAARAIPWLERRLSLGCSQPEREAIKAALAKLR